MPLTGPRSQTSGGIVIEETSTRFVAETWETRPQRNEAVRGPAPRSPRDPETGRPRAGAAAAAPTGRSIAPPGRDGLGERPLRGARRRADPEAGKAEADRTGFPASRPTGSGVR